MKSKPRAMIQPLRKKTTAPMVSVVGLDSDTLHMAQQLLTFSRPPTPTREIATTTTTDEVQHSQLLTPPHKIVSPLKFKRLSMSPVPFPNAALSSMLINSCENIAPEELLRQHRLRFKAVRKRWQKWHHERHKRLSRFEFKQSPRPSSPSTPCQPHKRETNHAVVCRTII